MELSRLIFLFTLSSLTNLRESYQFLSLPVFTKKNELMYPQESNWNYFYISSYNLKKKRFRNVFALEMGQVGIFFSS